MTKSKIRLYEEWIIKCHTPRVSSKLCNSILDLSKIRTETWEKKEKIKNYSFAWVLKKIKEAKNSLQKILQGLVN